MRSGQPRSRRTPRPNATSASAVIAACSRTCSSRWRSPRSRAIPRRCSPARGQSSRRRSATTRPLQSNPTGTGRLPRYTWRHAYAELREKLDALGRVLGGEYRVLVDENDHVDREAAARAGVGFYGKNTLMITRRHGSWVVLGTLVTEAELDADPAARDRLRRVSPLRRRVPDRGARRAGRPRLDALPLLLDAVAGADPGRVQGAARGPRVRLRHLPGRLPMEPRRREAPCRRAARRGRSSRSSTGSRPTTRSCARATTACTSRATIRGFLRRNALVAAGNVGGERERAAVASYAASDDELLREHALWALERIEART